MQIKYTVPGITKYTVPGITLPARYVIDDGKIGAVHMWREARSGGGMMLMSDTMWRAIQDAGLTGIIPRKVDVV